MERVVEELTDKLSLVESECNVKAQEIETLRSQLNYYSGIHGPKKNFKTRTRADQYYSTKLEEAEQKDSDSNVWIILGLGSIIGAEVGLAYYYGLEALLVVNNCLIVVLLLVVLQPTVCIGVRFVTKSGPKNKTE